MVRTTLDEASDAPTPFLTRRRFLLGMGSAGALAAFAGFGAAPYVLGHDDDDRDDDDNSGRGSDDDDDHSGHGGGDDDDDREDDDVVISGEVPAGSIEVRIVDDDPDGFSPTTVTIDVGQSVTFVNADDEAHTATGGSFDTDILQPGSMATIPFDEPGTFPYACEIHPEMIGTVEVRGIAGAASPEATPEAATPDASAGGETVITIANLAFDPAEVEVTAGATVTWANEDQLPHTATSLDGAFDTGTLDEGQTGSAQFDQPGRFEYQCAIHPGMTGTVVVV